jgi:hypothetical protein
MFPLAVAARSSSLTVTSATSIILLDLAILIGLIVDTRAQRASLRAVRALVQHLSDLSLVDLACSAIAWAKSFWVVVRVTAALASVMRLVRVLAAADVVIAAVIVNVVAIASAVAIVAVIVLVAAVVIVVAAAATAVVVVIVVVVPAVAVNVAAVILAKFLLLFPKVLT